MTDSPSLRRPRSPRRSRSRPSRQQQPARSSRTSEANRPRLVSTPFSRESTTHRRIDTGHAPRLPSKRQLHDSAPHLDHGRGRDGGGARRRRCDDGRAENRARLRLHHRCREHRARLPGPLVSLHRARPPAQSPALHADPQRRCVEHPATGVRPRPPGEAAPGALRSLFHVVAALRSRFRRVHSGRHPVAHQLDDDQPVGARRGPRTPELQPCPSTCFTPMSAGGGCSAFSISS